MIYVCTYCTHYTARYNNYLLVRLLQSGYSRARAESGYNVTPDGEPADDDRAGILQKEEGGAEHLDKVSRGPTVQFCQE